MRLQDLISNSSFALARYLNECQSAPVVGANYFDGGNVIVASITPNPQAVAGHLAQSSFFANNRISAEALLRLIGIWDEVTKAVQRNEEFGVSEQDIKSTAENLSITVIEHAQHFGAFAGKLIFLATYVGRGIEAAILRSRIARTTLNITPEPIQASILIDLSKSLPDLPGESSDDLTQQLLDGINEAVETFSRENDIKVHVQQLTANAPGQQITYDRAA